MVGVLSLQGAYQRHFDILKELQEDVLLVRKEEDLLKCQGLIIPGGESTVMTKLLLLNQLWDPLYFFKEQGRIIWGVCAGAVLLSKEITNYKQQQTLDFIDITVERNYFGSQLSSFGDYIDLKNEEDKLWAEFIRAPSIDSLGNEVMVLGEYKKEPVFVRQDNIIATTFHPELGSDFRIHQYFLSLL